MTTLGIAQLYNQEGVCVSTCATDFQVQGTDCVKVSKVNLAAAVAIPVVLVVVIVVVVVVIVLAVKAKKGIPLNSKQQEMVVNYA